MVLYLTVALRWFIAKLLFCSAIQMTVSFRISRTPPYNATIVVIGENSARVKLEWLYSDEPNEYFVQFWRGRPGEQLKQIATSRNGNAFDPRSTSEFEALLPATLVLKNVQRDEEYTYTIILLDSNTVWKARDMVTIDVVAPPEISDLPEVNPLLAIGENRTLTCNASGDPFPKITWTKDGIPMDKFNETGYHLHLNNVKLEDVGSYRCTANNGYGDDATTISIVGIRCDDCEIRILRVTLKNEVWRSALNNRSEVEFKTLESKLLSEISSIYTKNPGKQLYAVSLLGFSRADSSAAVAVLRLKFTDPLKPLEDEIVKGKLGSLIVGLERELPSTTGKPAVPMTRPRTASGFPKVTDQSEDRKKHQNMLGNHAIYLTIIFLLVMIITGLVFVIWRGRNTQGFTGASKQRGNLKYHCREDQFDIQVQETPLEVQLTECTNVQEYLLSDCDQSSSLQSANTLHEQTLVSSDYMPLDQSTKLRNWEIRREQVHITKMIGKGAFSQVAKAFFDTNGTEGQITVAVKMLKKNAPESDRKDLLSELEVMKELKPHPHVIKLMGCVTNSDPLLVLIEYIPYGDLLGYLRKSRGLNDTYFKDPDVKPVTNLTSEKLVRFSCQVANGMRYLSANKIIHRDLAARNILVGEGEECKVTDFGMARNVHQDDIYTIHSGGRLPAKWTAYEGLLYGTYTTQSDVWSFGVVLYEIFTVGGSPYPRINGREIANKLQRGYRMPKPKHVDEQLYQIMFQCWEEKPNNRPTFSQLEGTLKNLMQTMNTYVNLKEYDNNLYANIDDLLE